MKFDMLILLREKMEAPKKMTEEDKSTIKKAIKDGIKVKEIYKVLGYDKTGESQLRLDAIIIAEVDESSIKQKSFSDFLAILEKYWVVDWHIPIQKMYDDKEGWSI